MPATDNQTAFATADSADVGDVVRVRLDDGSIVTAKLQSVNFGGFLALVDGESSARMVTRWMIVG